MDRSLSINKQSNHIKRDFPLCVLSVLFGRTHTDTHTPVFLTLSSWCSLIVPFNKEHNIFGFLQKLLLFLLMSLSFLFPHHHQLLFSFKGRFSPVNVLARYHIDEFSYSHDFETIKMLTIWIIWTLPGCIFPQRPAQRSLLSPQGFACRFH